MSTEDFRTQVAAYNDATWGMGIAMSVAAAFLAYRVFVRPGARTDIWMKAFLSFAFAWNGIVFFLVYVKNPISTFTGVPLFIVVSLLFAAHIWAQKTHFRPPVAVWKRGVTAFWIVLVFLYPVIGWLLGHLYPRTLR